MKDCVTTKLDTCYNCGKSIGAGAVGTYGLPGLYCSQACMDAYDKRVSTNITRLVPAEKANAAIETADLNRMMTEQKEQSFLPKQIHEVISTLQETFIAKNKEYKGSHSDVFRNFNLGAELQKESPEQTLLGYVNKQVVSLFDAKHVNPERLKDEAFVWEKAKDIAIYMIILMAMVRENTHASK